jgi:hypothetical protein
MVIVAAIRGREIGSWSLWLRSASPESMLRAPYVVLHDRSEYATPEYRGFFRVLQGIEDAYECDRMMSYPTWNPILLSMKASGGPSEIVDDVRMPGWKGFMRVRNTTWGDTVIRDLFCCNSYSLEDTSTACVIISSTRGSVTHSHVRDMLATLEFRAEARDAAKWSEMGTVALSNERYTDASIAFLNAFYVDGTNPKYAYLFAKSLYDDPREAFRKNRLGTSVNFLRDALELDPAYAEARELLSRVEPEYEALKERGTRQRDSAD